MPFCSRLPLCHCTAATSTSSPEGRQGDRGGRHPPRLRLPLRGRGHRLRRAGRRAAGGVRREAHRTCGRRGGGRHSRGRPSDGPAPPPPTPFPGPGLIRTTTTAPVYRLHALRTDPPKSGLEGVGEGGGRIEAEVWEGSCRPKVSAR
ncbi:allophanate hydrolase-related protein [Streptomyces atratus]|uniref:allophanate hydrolase-related protein n=1 Tax=Streptomyces atratus TaxID=1893 RepID=UPI003F541323